MKKDKERILIKTQDSDIRFRHAEVCTKLKDLKLVWRAKWGSNKGNMIKGMNVVIDDDYIMCDDYIK